MKQEEYVGTYNVNGVEVKLGMDDYGQCYFIEFIDPKTKELKELSLGTYNLHYMEEMYGLFDETYWNLYEKSVICKKTLTEEEQKKFDEYKKIFDKEYEKYHLKGMN